MPPNDPPLPHRILVRPSGVCTKPDQVGARCYGPVFGWSYVARQCLCNAVNALVNRHAACGEIKSLPIPVPPHLVSSIASAYLSCLMPHFLDPFLWLSKWTRSKRHAIAQSILGHEIKPKAIKAFIKFETQHKMPTKARLIQGYPNLKTQELFAREFTAFQKALVQVMSPDDPFEIYPGIHVAVASGSNAAGIADWMRRALVGSVCFYERDGKNWDSTMGPEAHSAKIKVMTACDPSLAAFVDMCSCVVGFVSSGDERLVYRLQYTVKSGHNDTTSGNGLNNALITSAVFHRLGVPVSILVTGDDLIAVVYAEIELDQVMAMEREYGIIPEARVFRHVHDVTFASGCFYYDASADHVSYVPLLGRLLKRLWWSTTHFREDKWADYKHSVVSGLLASCGGMPLYADWLRANDVIGAQRITISRDRFNIYDVQQSGVPISVVAHRYAITVEQASAIALYLSTCNEMCYYVNDSLLGPIFAKDLADISERVVTA